MVFLKKRNEGDAMGFLLTPIDLNQNQDTLIHAAESWAEKLKKINHLIYINKVAGKIKLSYLPIIINAPILEEAKEDILKADQKRVEDLISLHGKKYCKGFAMAGSPATEIDYLIKSKEYEMIMVGHDYEKYKDSIFIGSTTDQIIRSSNRPVAIIRDEKSVEPKKMALLIDFTHNADQITEQGKKLAKAFGAEVTFFHVAPHYLTTVSYALGTNTGINALLTETENKAKIFADKKFNELVADFKDHGIQADFVVSKEKVSVEETIEDFLDKNHFDLVVMGAHSQGVIERIILGSVSYHVVHKTSNNILLVL